MNQAAEAARSVGTAILLRCKRADRFDAADRRVFRKQEYAQQLVALDRALRLQLGAHRPHPRGSCAVQGVVGSRGAGCVRPQPRGQSGGDCGGRKRPRRTLGLEEGAETLGELLVEEQHDNVVAHRSVQRGVRVVGDDEHLLQSAEQHAPARVGEAQQLQRGGQGFDRDRAGFLVLRGRLGRRLAESRPVVVCFGAKFAKHLLCGVRIELQQRRSIGRVRRSRGRAGAPDRAARPVALKRAQEGVVEAREETLHLRDVRVAPARDHGEELAQRAPTRGGILVHVV